MRAKSVGWKKNKTMSFKRLKKPCRAVETAFQNTHSHGQVEQLMELCWAGAILWLSTSFLSLLSCLFFCILYLLLYFTSGCLPFIYLFIFLNLLPDCFWNCSYEQWDALLSLQASPKLHSLHTIQDSRKEWKRIKYFSSKPPSAPNTTPSCLSPQFICLLIHVLLALHFVGLISISCH